MDVMDVSHSSSTSSGSTLSSTTGKKRLRDTTRDDGASTTATSLSTLATPTTLAAGRPTTTTAGLHSSVVSSSSSSVIDPTTAAVITDNSSRSNNEAEAGATSSTAGAAATAAKSTPATNTPPPTAPSSAFTEEEELLKAVAAATGEDDDVLKSAAAAATVMDSSASTTDARHTSCPPVARTPPPAPPLAFLDVDDLSMVEEEFETPFSFEKTEEEEKHHQQQQQLQLPQFGTGGVTPPHIPSSMSTTKFTFCNVNSLAQDHLRDQHHQFINDSGHTGAAQATTAYTFCNVNSETFLQERRYQQQYHPNPNTFWFGGNNSCGPPSTPTSGDPAGGGGFGINPISAVVSSFRNKTKKKQKKQSRIQQEKQTTASFKHKNNTIRNNNGKDMAVVPEHENVDDSISKVLLKLSLQERTNMEEEVHGVRFSFKDETPEVLNQALHEFDIALLQVKESVARATIRDTNTDVLRYTVWLSSETPIPTCTTHQQHRQKTSSLRDTKKTQKSKTRSSSSTSAEDGCYLNDPNIRLRFLRIEYFNAVKAVTRFVCFLEFAQELFGNFVAERPISIGDFETTPKTADKKNRVSGDDKTELKTLMNSRCQLLNSRDRSGRRVLIYCGSCNHDTSDPILRYKIIMYLYWIASEDIETQQKGIVVITWPSHEERTTATVVGRNQQQSEIKNNTPTTATKTGNSDEQWQILRSNILHHDIRYHKLSFEAIPARIASIHFCALNNHPVYKVLERLFYFGLPYTMYDLKSRFKTHFGERTEIRYRLQSYGIPVDLLPITHSGAIKLTNHIHSMKSRKEIERQHTYYQTYYEHQPQKLRQAIYHSTNISLVPDLQQQGPPPKKKIRKEELTPMTLHYNKQRGTYPKAATTAVSTASTEATAAVSKTAADEAVPFLLQHQLIVECPGSADVIFRKGKQYGNHVGNSVLLNTLLDHTYLDHLNATTQGAKVEMTWRIVHEIERRGGRFLEWDINIYNGGAWVHIINDNKKRDKVAQCYKVYSKQRRLQKSRR